MQLKTSQQSSQRDAVKQTMTELLPWREEAGDICQSENDLVRKLLNLVNEHKLMSR